MLWGSLALALAETSGQKKQRIKVLKVKWFFGENSAYGGLWFGREVSSLKFHSLRLPESSNLKELANWKNLSAFFFFLRNHILPARSSLSCSRCLITCRHGHDVGVLAISVTNLSQIKTDFNQRQLALKMGPQIGFHLYFGWPNLDTSLLFVSLSYNTTIHVISITPCRKRSRRSLVHLYFLMLELWVNHHREAIGVLRFGSLPFRICSCLFCSLSAHIHRRHRGILTM